MTELTVADQIEIVEPTRIELADGRYIHFHKESQTKWGMSLDGLILNVSPESRLRFIPSEKGRVKIKAGTLVGKVDLIPNNQWEHDPLKRTSALTALLDGVDNILSVSDLQDIEQPEFLMNSSNPEMANFMKRFGFINTQPPEKSPPGSVGMLARTEDFRLKFEEFKAKNPLLIAKLIKRKRDLEDNRK